ncbi:MAG TPA: exosortase system-associated protein, TIGR04073 family [Deltaproteobacteria bacterium]|nr:exosortase system-associated protein, TIGR04073 family [Deltaproteobacteria bacterium]HQB38793.1 exosortase system-associated protein, TIGR04073 family [Deltaproteobacteria bacterium]
MKKYRMLLALLVAFVLAVPLTASADEKPETIVEKMAVKFTRGLANAATCVVELPKQTILSVQEMGGVGYVVGPLKGIGMTVYRGVLGAAEAAFFLVPQPGYYDPMTDPPYVWDGWEPKRQTSAELPAEESKEDTLPQ